MRVEVEDVNEFGPEFVQQQSSYIVEVEEGKIVDEILKLKTVDNDGSSDYSMVCHYEVYTPNAPFKIDTDGKLIAPTGLSYETNNHHIVCVG